MINGLRQSNPSRIVPVIDAVGWRRIWNAIDGEECAQFIKIAGEAYRKNHRDPAHLHGPGSAPDRRRGRRHDGLSYDLDGIEQIQFDALKARP